MLKFMSLSGPFPASNLNMAASYRIFWRAMIFLFFFFWSCFLFTEFKLNFCERTMKNVKAWNSRIRRIIDVSSYERVFGSIGLSLYNFFPGFQIKPKLL